MRTRSRLAIGILMLALFIVASSSACLADDGGYFGTDYDLGGVTVTIGHWQPATFSARFNEGEIAEGRLEQAEELFNCKIKFDGVDYNSIGEWYLARLMSGDSAYDIWNVQNRIAYFPLVTQDALFSVDNIVGEDYWDRLAPYEAYVSNTLKFMGKNYVFSAAVDYDDMDRIVNGFYLIYYNKTMLEQAGAEDPYELYKAGEWDWDAMGRIAKQVTKDLDGDGAFDQWGMAKIFNWLAHPFLRSNGALYTTGEENGKVVFSLGGEAAESALMQLYEWNMVDKLFDPGWDALASFTSNTVGFMVYPLWNYETIADQSGFEIGIVPMPRGTHVDRCVTSVHAIGGVVLPANSAKPEAMMALYEFLFRDDEDTRADAFDRDLSVYRSREDAEIALEVTENWQGETAALYVEDLTVADLYLTTRQVVDDIIFGRLSFSESVNTYRPVIQGILDDLFNSY